MVLLNQQKTKTYDLIQENKGLKITYFTKKKMIFYNTNWMIPWNLTKYFKL